MAAKPKFKRKIRRFTDDVLSKELRKSIREMSKTITVEIAKKAMANLKES